MSYQDRILPKYGKGVAVFAMFANIFEFVTSLLWLGIILDPSVKLSGPKHCKDPMGS